MHHPPSSSWTARHLVRLLVVVIAVGLAPSSTTVRGFPMFSVPTKGTRRTATAATTRRYYPSIHNFGGSGLAYSKKQFEVMTHYRRRSQFHNTSKKRSTGTTTNRPTLVAASAFWKQSSQEGGDDGGGNDGDTKDEDDEKRKTKLDETNQEEENDDDVDDEDNEAAATGTTAVATSLEVVGATSADTETNETAEVAWGSYSSTASSSSSTTDNNKDDDILVINGMTTKPSAITPTDDNEGNSSSTTTNKSLVTLLNDIGNNFKSMAETATTKGTASSEQSMKIVCAIQASLYYTLFIVYRSYRGFFVLLPATIRRVYQQMNTVMTNNSDTSNLSMVAEDENEKGEDGTTKMTPAAATPPTWKTKVTVSLLTVVVTSSYLVGGVLQMATQFIRTIAHTSNVSKSFEAAADEMVDYEARISRVAGSSDE